MAEDRMALLELAEKHADGDFLGELRQFALQRLMEAEVQGRCGAGLLDEQTDEWQVTRRYTT